METESRDDPPVKLESLIRLFREATERRVRVNEMARTATLEWIRGLLEELGPLLDTNYNLFQIERCGVDHYDRDSRSVLRARGYLPSPMMPARIWVLPFGELNGDSSLPDCFIRIESVWHVGSRMCYSDRPNVTVVTIRLVREGTKPDIFEIYPEQFTAELLVEMRRYLTKEVQKLTAHLNEETNRLEPYAK